jgi:hypothetical protein
MELRFGLFCIAVEQISADEVIFRAEIVFGQSAAAGHILALLYREEPGRPRAIVRQSKLTPGSAAADAELHGYIFDVGGEMLSAACLTPDGAPEQMVISFTKIGFELFSPSREAVTAAFVSEVTDRETGPLLGTALGIDQARGHIIRAPVATWQQMGTFLDSRGIRIGFGPLPAITGAQTY